MSHLNLYKSLTAALLAIACCPSFAIAQINGFTEPLLTVDLSSDETGSIAELNIREGSIVNKGDILAQLDDRVQKLLVESARHLADSTNAMEAARSTLEKRELVSSRIRELISTGHATESEMLRADLEEAIALARFRSSQEESVGRGIDLRRAELMLERRLIRAPFTGIVSTIHRQQGEFLSPLRPELVTLIQVDRLLAVFNVPSPQIESLKQKSNITVSFHDGSEVLGELHSIGVQTDAESGTVQVMILLINDDGKLRSGEQCFLEIIE